MYSFFCACFKKQMGKQFVAQLLRGCDFISLYEGKGKKYFVRTVLRNDYRN